MEPLLVDLKPRQKLFEHKPHEGEEFGYVLQGRIRLHLDDRQYTVKKGESFYYSSDHYHFIENASASPARFLWISTPPTF
jgi:quercetin dioxygenase-like cupin family protein